MTSPDLRPLLGGVDPATASEERLAVQPGDLLIGGTHGLFDMVWLHGQPSSQLRAELFTMVKGAQDPGFIANSMASLAATVGGANFQGTPLAQQLAKEGRGAVPMQDVGDNTVLVAYVAA